MTTLSVSPTRANGPGRMAIAFALAGASVLLTSSAAAQGPTLRDTIPYLDPSAPIESRVRDLLARMTVEEKVSQLLYSAPAIERLGIPEYNWWSEALHGVARAGRATVFPQAIGLAATWDTALMHRAAVAISDEARAKHHAAVRQGRRGIYEGLTFFSPNINIFRDPRWGRGMETFGEDPFLTGRLAVAFIEGMQGEDPHYLKTAATAKHFAVHSGPEPDRHTFDAVVGERDLRETYLPAFRAAVVDGHVESVMCAYNRFRGEPACASEVLLRRILRGEWGFDGYVVSDCWAISDIYSTHKVVESEAEAAAIALAAGTDLNCGDSYDSLVEAVRLGLVDEARIDTAVARLFRTRFRLGMLDPPEAVPFAGIPYDVVDSDEHRQLALQAARESIVLLKNEGDLLPLDPSSGTIAVIGPNAADVEVLLGNYNGIPTDPVTPLNGIRRQVSPGTRVIFARGTDVAAGSPAFQVVPPTALLVDDDGIRMNGLRAHFYNNPRFDGKPFRTRIDGLVSFNWWEAPPVAGMRADDFSVRWEGRLVPPVSGRYALALRAFGTARLYLDDSLLVEFSDRHVVWTRWREVELRAGEPRRIRIEYSDRRADASVQLLWSVPNPRLRQEALEAAALADVVIAVMGLSPRLEGEEMPVGVPGFAGGDRVELGLPDPQQELLRELADLEKPIVLVLLNGSPLALNWAAEHIPAIVEAWYPGQAAGTAIAEVLFGAYVPAGRLPVTFYRTVDQLPPFTDYRMAGRTYRYFEGEPLFPFGHGLSYTTFEYDSLSLPARVEAGEDVTVQVQVVNTGRRSAEEVVELYVHDLEASVPVPIRSLAGFRRVFLRPDERRLISFTLTPRQLSIIDERSRRVVEPGRFEVSVGGKQPGFGGLADPATTGVLTGSFDVVGERTIIERSR